MRYNRIILLEVMILHQRQDSQYCRCGWGELGRSHAEHIATAYEQAVVEASKSTHSHDGVHLGRVIHPRDRH